MLVVVIVTSGGGDGDDGDALLSFITSKAPAEHESHKQNKTRDHYNHPRGNENKQTYREEPRLACLVECLGRPPLSHPLTAASQIATT